MDPEHPAAAYLKERYEHLMEIAEESYFQSRPAPSDEELSYFRTMTRSTLAMADGLQLQWLVDPSVDVAGTMAVFLEQIRTFMTMSAEQRNAGQ